MQSGPQDVALLIFTRKFLHFLRKSLLFHHKCPFGYSFRYGSARIIALRFLLEV